jgi:hypothetical protein
MSPAKRVTSAAKPRARAGTGSKSAPKKAARKTATRASAKPAKKTLGKKPAKRTAQTVPAAEVAQQPPIDGPLVLTAVGASAAEQYERKAARSAAASRSASAAGREIPPLNTRGINWERRLACSFDLERHGRTYMPNVFSLPPSRDHKRVVEKLQRASYEGGSFAVAMPRGGGKSAWCRASMNWATSHGHRRYPYCIGANDDAALKTLKALRTISLGSDALLQDYPELYAPVRALGQDSAHKARGQLYHGRSTHLEWGADRVIYPALLLTAEEIKPYQDHVPDLVVQLGEWWTLKSGGSVVETAGITSGVRGGNHMHPLFQELMRPDYVLLDDIQNDAGARSPGVCEKMIELVEGAIDGLAGPGELLAIVMPCTVIFEGDVADTFLDHDKKPSFQGERCSMVISWPPGIDDYEINDETEAGKHWLRYQELLKVSFKQHGDIRLATEYYREHRDVMDEGFVVSWPERFNNKKKHGHNRELSAQQHAMNKRFKSPRTFPAEFQNRPKQKLLVAVPIKADQVAARTFGYEEGECPPHTHAVATFIDVQDEILFYMTGAVDRDFTGGFIQYGTWPELNVPYFTKAQTQSWCLLSRALFDAHPEAKAQATQNSAGKIKAPLEAKIYHAVRKCVTELLAREYPRAEAGGMLRNMKIGVDARWGKASDAIKRSIGDLRRADVIPCMGQFVSPANRQYEEYQRTPGWIFEDHVHPGLQEVKWIWRPGPDGVYYLSVDSNRVKTFLMSRLTCPPGARGAMQLYRAPAERHQLVSQHIADSEYPEDYIARGRKKEIFQERDGSPDNDLLDCAAMLMALLSMCGARLQENLDPSAAANIPRRPSLKDRWRAKHGG